MAHALTDALRTGQAAAPMVLGAPFWDYLAAHPEQQALFDEQMRQQAQVLSLACVPVLNWPATGTTADIAGGVGTLLAAVLQAAPGTQGIVVDQPHVLERARPFLERQGVDARCVLQPGDLFAPPPPADLYLLARVLHDWDDDHAARILAALGRGEDAGQWPAGVRDAAPRRRHTPSGQDERRRDAAAVWRRPRANRRRVSGAVGAHRLAA